jgi:hypothetical protein
MLLPSIYDSGACRAHLFQRDAAACGLGRAAKLVDQRVDLRVGHVQIELRQLARVAHRTAGLRGAGVEGVIAGGDIPDFGVRIQQSSRVESVVRSRLGLSYESEFVDSNH